MNFGRDGRRAMNISA